MSGHDKQTDGSIEVREEQGTEKDRNRERETCWEQRERKKKIGTHIHTHTHTHTERERERERERETATTHSWEKKVHVRDLEGQHGNKQTQPEMEYRGIGIVIWSAYRLDS